MAINSSIEWTEATWNPVAGCSIMSPGCTNCYAMRLARRLEAIGQEKYKGLTRVSGGRPKWTGRVKLDEASLRLPSTWKKSKTIFVNSMSDLFHEDVPLEFIQRVFDVMRSTPQHTYQVLTKRAEQLEELSSEIDWPVNVWMGVSVESRDYNYRIKHLLKTQAQVKFLSLEPLLGPLGKFAIRGIDWVIVGGESGPGSRKMKEEWVQSIHNRCKEFDVAFHFKQWGGVNKKKAGRELNGRTWDELPKVA